MVNVQIGKQRRCHHKRNLVPPASDHRLPELLEQQACWQQPAPRASSSTVVASVSHDASRFECRSAVTETPGKTTARPRPRNLHKSANDDLVFKGVSRKAFGDTGS